jgi:hypothetical protein
MVSGVSVQVSVARFKRSGVLIIRPAIGVEQKAFVSRRIEFSQFLLENEKEIL